MQISSIGFIKCGLEASDDLRYVHIERITVPFGYRVQIQVALLFVECCSVLLENVTVMESYGYGVLGHNMMAKLNHCLFHNNYWRRRADSNIQQSSSNNSNLSEIKLPGGNALFKYKSNVRSTLHCPQNATEILKILHSDFAHGGNQYESSSLMFEAFIHGGGLVIDIESGYLAVDAININITVYNCSMYNNTASVGANMLLSVHMPLDNLITVHINNCKFWGGKSNSKGGGFMLEINSYTFSPYQTGSLTVYLVNSELYSNSAANGSAIYLGAESISKDPTMFIIERCKCHNNLGEYGSGMYVLIDLCMNYFRTSIDDLVFAGNNATFAGGAIYINLYHTCETGDQSWFFGSILLYLSPEARPFILELYQSKFIQNAAHFGGTALEVYINEPVHLASFWSNTTINPTSLIQLTLKSTIFDKHFMLADTIGRGFDCTVLQLSYVRNITIASSTFSDNKCTSVTAKNSKFQLQGSVEFLRNTGYSGGALAFHRDAHNCEPNRRIRVENSMILTPHTTVYIVNNTAVRYGGGIIADDECIVEHYCFFQTNNVNYTRMDARVVMEGNRAGKAGDSIFGGCLSSCYLTMLSPLHKTILRPKLFSSLFQIHGQTQSEVAAIPHKVCLCDGDQLEGSVGYKYHCISDAIIAQFRGETFHVLAVIVGDYGYASPALVRTVIAPGDAGELGEQQSIQELGKKCANLTYSVRTPQESLNLQLEIESLTDNQMHLTLLNISFRPCPLGFNLSDTPSKCDCALQLRKPGVKCNINTQLIHRPALVWIGNYSDEVVVHTNCPFDYCKPTDNEISLYEQDQQCAFNRSGVLCGACQPGLSLALGTSQCMQCSNIYILLFIPFALAGVVLIILMLKCNLTVSTGTLNGLIFYANIIRANHAVFFPLRKSEGFTSFLSVFIAWLNLDLGVEVCFFRGMDTYIRTWLQFVFPLYIWVLVGLMICSSRYSTTIARLSGSNTVSVLATLFLLSYAKLLQTIIASISLTTLTDRHGNTSAVWLLDGNMPAMKGSHIPLVVMSIVALVVYVVPFTMLVLLGPCLQSRSNHRLLQWVTKIKPLLDAYQGPYRDKFRYWTGLLLLVRIVLFAIFGGNALGDP